MEKNNKEDSNTKIVYNYSTIRKDIAKQNPLYNDFVDVCLKSNNLYNTTNYYIRQIYFKTQNDKENKASNENTLNVYNEVQNALPELDKINIKTLNKKVAKFQEELSQKDLSQQDKEDLSKKLEKVQKKLENFKNEMPQNGFISYEMLEGVFKVTNNIDYRSLSSHVAQQTMKACYNNWKSFFESLEAYKETPSKFNGRPKPPGYKKKNAMSQATYTNQVIGISWINGKCFISFYKIKGKKLLFGKYLTPDKQAKIQEIKVQPYYGNIRVTVIFADKVVVKADKPQKEEASKDEKIINDTKTTNNVKEETTNNEETTSSTKEGVRIMGIDLGVSNFATISNNIGIKPLVIKGRFIKSRNQYFNKRRSILISKLSKKKEYADQEYPKIKNTKRLDSLSRKRDNFFHDCFYKFSHRIIKEALDNQIDTIVVGKNDGWKQKPNMGKKNNQNFVCIPYNEFLYILEYLCRKNGINFIEREESYTSQANMLNLDAIPTYNKNDKDAKFTGKRNRRWYTSNEGKYKGVVISADVNGASNIIRKEFPHAFDNVDLAYLLKPMYLNFEDFYALNKKQLEKHIKAAPCKVEKSADVASLIGLKPNQCHVKG
jgi:putative transposase